MYCIFCHKIDDFHSSYICAECRAELANANRHAMLMYLLAKAYDYVTEDSLRAKIEDTIFVFTI